jgi:hypothetical protein
MNAEVKFSGQAAQLGRPSVIQDISARLIDQFVQRLRTELDTASSPGESHATDAPGRQQAQKPIAGLSLLVAAARGALARLFHIRTRPREKGSP